MPHSSRLRLLLLGTDHPEWEEAHAELVRAGYELVRGAARPEQVELYSDPPCLLAIVDLEGSTDAPEKFLSQMRALRPSLPVLAVQARNDPTPRSRLITAGAVEVLETPNARGFTEAVRRHVALLHGARLQRKTFTSMGPHLDGIVGRSQAMVDLYAQMARVAQSPAPVLIIGETGTGKELIAGALHRASGRGSFVPVNCGAIPSHLLEAELFGHVKGAFTGAVSDRKGLFEEADGGTLFLDEIGELPLTLQPKLLRALQFGEYRRVGEVNTRTVDVRLIAATHRDLKIEIDEKRFREDLYFRINVLHLEIPALRERSTDIPLIAERLLSQIHAREGRGPRRLAPAALAALISFSWPGNVRQLQNVIERAALYADADEIRMADLPSELREALPDRSMIREAADRGLTLDELEREYTLEVLRRCRGNKSKASEILGIPRRTLYRRLAGYAEAHEKDVTKGPT
jgi:DNA-binding NtrC family response regulator